MPTIKAIVRNGQIEIEQPLDLPNGTELTITLPQCHISDDEAEDSPAAINAWIRWYDELEPVEFTEEERAAWHAARQDDRQRELAQWSERSQRIEEKFP